MSPIYYVLVIGANENCSQGHNFVPYDHKKFKEILYELVSALIRDEMTVYKEEAPCLSSCANSDTVY